MSAAVLAILGPLAAAALVLLARRVAGLLAVTGAAVGLLGATLALADPSPLPRPVATLPGLPGLPLRLVVDPLGAVLAVVVATVGLLVLVYALGYMAEERDRPRFFAGMSFFVAAMQTLVLAGDWLLFLAAWETIAVASWLLIGFWFDRPGVPAAATRAFTTTRAADLGLYVGVFALTWAAGTTEIAATQQLGGGAPVVAGLALLVAAMGKSAQAPLQGWLLDAMAGPTPVSALLHSATLVVAGVVLLVRADPLLAPEARLVVGVVGGVTAVVTGLTAAAQPDLKRLLAASTSSQLGLMLVALGAGSPAAAVVHLVANAAMKSALFLGAGVFQHARGSTVFAELGGVGREHRATFGAMGLAGLALAGVPPLAGFWSKDAIIAAALDSAAAGVLVPLALAATVLTGVYVARTLRLLWGGTADHPAARPASGSAAVAMGAPLAVLVALAAAFGLGLPSLDRLLGAHAEQATVAVVLGLAGAAAGLGVGWLLPADRLLGPLTLPARDGFRVGGGFDHLVVRPAFALARALDGLDGAIHRGVLGVGREAIGVARVGSRVDAWVHGGVVGVGRASLALAAAARRLDENGIDRLIADLVVAVRNLGVRARGLQTGLVHRELMVAAAATVVVVVLLVLR